MYNLNSKSSRCPHQIQLIKPQLIRSSQGIMEVDRKAKGGSQEKENR
jgi:hypothetical protein